MTDPSATDGFPCGACRLRPPAYDRLLAGWLYEPPIREVIVGLKFGRLEYLAEELAGLLATRLSAELQGCAVVVPTPLYWTRSLARGYNQAELIARGVAETLGLPLARNLRRRRSTRPQTGLDRGARRANLRNAFRWRGPGVAGRAHWLLIDDVFTTGATLDSAARALKRAGVARVTAMVAAATPHPDEVADRTDRPE
jgi:ComF family protein